MDKKLLSELMEVKEYPCVSIIIPTYRTAPENQKNAIRLKKMVKDSSDRLEKGAGEKGCCRACGENPEPGIQS